MVNQGILVLTHQAIVMQPDSPPASHPAVPRSRLHVHVRQLHTSCSSIRSPSSAVRRLEWQTHGSQNPSGKFNICRIRPFPEGGFGVGFKLSQSRVRRVLSDPGHVRIRKLRFSHSKCRDSGPTPSVTTSRCPLPIPKLFGLPNFLHDTQQPQQPQQIP